MYPENPEGTQVIVGSMNMGYISCQAISDTARNRTHNLFRPKREPIPLGHSAMMFFPYVLFSRIVSEIVNMSGEVRRPLHGGVVAASAARRPADPARTSALPFIWLTTGLGNETHRAIISTSGQSQF